MKVEVKKMFQPVTITLESQEEVEMMWHKLNQTIQRGYAHNVRASSLPYSLSYTIWKTFDEKVRSTLGF